MGINDHIGWIRTLDGFSGDLGITCLSIHLKPQTSLIAKGWGGRVAWGGCRFPSENRIKHKYMVAYRCL